MYNDSIHHGSCSSLGKGHSDFSVSEPSAYCPIEHSRLQFFESLVAPQKFDQGYLHLQVGQILTNACPGSSAEVHIAYHHEVRILETRIFVSVRTELRGRVEVFRVKHVRLVHVVEHDASFDRNVCNLPVLRRDSVEQEPRRGTVESVSFFQNPFHELELFDGRSCWFISSSDVLLDLISDFLKDAWVLVEMIDGCNNETCRGVLPRSKEDVHFLEEDFFHVGCAIQVFDHEFNDVLWLIGLALALLRPIDVDVLADGLHEHLLGASSKLVQPATLVVEVQGSCLVSQKKHQGMEAHFQSQAVQFVDRLVDRLSVDQFFSSLHPHKQGDNHLAKDPTHNLKKIELDSPIGVDCFLFVLSDDFVANEADSGDLRHKIVVVEDRGNQLASMLPGLALQEKDRIWHPPVKQMVGTGGLGGQHDCVGVDDLHSQVGADE